MAGPALANAAADRIDRAYLTIYTKRLEGSRKQAIGATVVVKG